MLTLFSIWMGGLSGGRQCGFRIWGESRGVRMGVKRSNLREGMSVMNEQNTKVRNGAARGKAGSKTVLIVEDNELNMKLFHDLLEAHGYDTLQTRDGVEALKIARERKPDLILMDIQLPEVSGLEVAKWIKEDDRLKSIPIVAVTAFAMKGDEEKIRQGGCEAYIAKPISVSQFLETVQRFLN
jgi:two-component system, cell cycle response regulator DivK